MFLELCVLYIEELMQHPDTSRIMELNELLGIPSKSFSQTSNSISPFVGGLPDVGFDQIWCSWKACNIFYPISLSLHDLELKVESYRLRKYGAQDDFSKCQIIQPSFDYDSDQI